jgi:hypothetical protein
MVRIKESLTIEKEISDYLRKMAIQQEISTSELVNRIIRLEMDKHKDIWSELDDFKLKRQKLEDEEKKIFEKIEVIIEEGSKQEVQKARKELEEQKERFEEFKLKMIICYRKLKEYNFLNQILEYDDVDSLRKIAKEIYKKIVVEECRPLNESIGFSDIKKLKEFMKQINFDSLIEIKEQ